MGDVILDSIPLVITIDGRDHLVDVSVWIDADVPVADRPKMMTRVVQGWLTRADVTELTVIDDAPLLVNWRSVEFFEVRVP